jgi:hypothetical protein
MLLRSVFLGLLLWLFFSQTFSLVHASVHEFHEHSELCDLVDSLPNSASLPNHAPITLPDDLPLCLSVTAHYEFIGSFISHAFLARAPPLVN